MNEIKRKTGLLLLCLLPLAQRAAAAEAEKTAVVPDVSEVISGHLLDRQPGLVYMEADPEKGWYSFPVDHNQALKEAAARMAEKNGLIVPIFPTVCVPVESSDTGYYNYVLRDGGIKKGDKVLVVGSGSGADSWLAWLNSGSDIYALDINPLAVANTRALAALAGFRLHSVVGDITAVTLPEGFSGFDHVLANMPYLEGDAASYEGKAFLDGDDGRVLDGFLARLPGLLKPGGKAVLLNTEEALRRIKAKGVFGVKVLPSGAPNTKLILLSNGKEAGTK
ncbi:MAG: hypothetical protein A2X32_11845 [Elusimicrobia bacterium GWC2_64_44]|nr:MAG: hypothetical protein A2X32_11845 [Elusimicrobia bacterium GWC2_64_44]